jgi:TolB-like protein/lipoprotein NlpI
VAQEEEPRADARPDSGLPSRLSVVLRELARLPEAETEAAWERVLAPGLVIGRYELVREVGRGAFGVVYEALDRELGRAVAFKAVRAGAHRVDVREERLFREAEAAAGLSHPNIVTLFDVGRSEQGPYLVLELLRGRALARRIERGPLSVIEALRIGVDVAKGLAHAHANGIVHRDLTPGNVFLCDEDHVKVLDFGMAHAFGRRRMDGGTPGYMAPEQRRGAPEDERTDVFALGVILFRMLSGELPYPPGGARLSLPVPLLNVPGAPALGDFIARMLEQDPVKRPRDAGEVLATLAPALAELQRVPSSGDLPPARKRWRPRLGVAAVLAIGVGAALAAAWGAKVMGEREARREAHASLVPSIAVLPFVDLSPEKDKEYFSDGLADEILSALARVDGLRVPGRTSSFFFKGKNARLADIGKELNVAAVLEGSVRMVGNRVRVTAQAVNVVDGRRLWGQTYDREVIDIFAVQDDIARSVASALDAKLAASNTVRGAGHDTSNPEVYAQYLLGRQHYHRLTRQGFRQAVEAFQKATDIDPGYAPAWAGLAVPLYYAAQDAQTSAAAAAQRRRALAAAEKAVALSPNLPEALSSRGILRAFVEYDWAGAKADLERAIALHGNDAEARRRYGVLLMDLGRIQDGIAELRRAVQLDPLGQSWTALGALYEAAGQHALSEAAFRRHLEFTPDGVGGMMGLGRALLQQSRPEDALAVFRRCPAEDYRLWGETVAEHALGRSAASQAALEALIAKYGHTSAFYIAEVYAWRGDKDAAFRWLERAVSEPGALGGKFRMSAFLRKIDDDPRYAAVLRKMKLPVD